MGNLLPRYVVERVDTLVGHETFADFSPIQRMILTTIGQDGELNHEQLKTCLEIHPRDLTLELQKFVKQGAILPAFNTNRSTTTLYSI